MTFIAVAACQANHALSLLTPTTFLILGLFWRRNKLVRHQWNPYTVIAARYIWAGFGGTLATWRRNLTVPAKVELITAHPGVQAQFIKAELDIKAKDLMIALTILQDRKLIKGKRIKVYSKILSKLKS